MIIRFLTAIVSVALLLAFSCASQNKLEKKRLDCAERVAKASELYKAGKYSSVLYRLEDARMQCGGSDIMDTVQFLLGMANLKSKKYVEARTEFQRLVQDFPGSSFFDEAKFRIGYAEFMQSNSFNRDQKETRDAIRLFDDFIESFPRSPFIDSAVFYRSEATEKLALKEFKNAEFYVKANEPDAAVVYFKSFLTQFPESKMVDQARFNAIELLVKLDRLSEAAELKDELVSKGKNKELIKAATALVVKKQKDTPVQK